MPEKAPLDGAVPLRSNPSSSKTSSAAASAGPEPFPPQKPRQPRQPRIVPPEPESRKLPEDPNELEKETRALRSLVRPAVQASNKGLEMIGKVAGVPLTGWDKGESEMWELSGAAYLYEAGGKLSGKGMLIGTALFIGGAKAIELMMLMEEKRRAQKAAEKFGGTLQRAEPPKPATP